MSERKDGVPAEARRAKAPVMSIETAPADDSETFGANSGDDAAASDDAGTHAHTPFASDDLKDAVGFIQGLGAAAWRYAVAHPYTVAYGFIGLVLAVLILVIGLWSTIVIAVFSIVGAMIGQIRDGDNGIVNFFRRLFRGGR